MDTKVLTLSEFLLDRISEDEAVAREALDAEGPRWNAQEINYEGISVWGNAEGGQVSFENEDEEPVLRHLVRFDPARVMAECEAKRRIMVEHRVFIGWVTEREYCDSCGDRHDVAYPCDTLRFLASVYAGHPDYDEAWRP